MTKKLLPLFAILFLLLTVPAYAKNPVSSDANCDEDASWENHGAFVSCVARLGQGGTSVSVAAHTSIGKHEDEEIENENEEKDENDIDNDEDDILTTPTNSPTPSPSPSPTTTTTNTEVKLALGEIIQSLQALITQLQNLISG